ncbi:hypothetical protein PV336_16275 [Streptomyces sp. MI02-2A]|uniref:hypothetical protein n=1 Tax=Streptomyces sp. MI02-2A TaxID=3028688 RepID=UPI0029A673F2|nr:hypothetical protein [Streptomyces sp. MI02-2A]MDX3260778.1 hypothetical protein [Streptomyces sp. MI02-2A]
MSDALLWRDTKSEADREADKLRPAARRRGFDVVVRGSRRRYGNRVYTDPPYGVFLEPINS